MCFLNFLHEDILPQILKTDKAGFWEIVFVVYIIGQTRQIGQKQNILHFNKSNITFCALNDSPYMAISFCENCMSEKSVSQITGQNALDQLDCRIF